jgi:hypothetical protein
MQEMREKIVQRNEETLFSLWLWRNTRNQSLFVAD